VREELSSRVVSCTILVLFLTSVSVLTFSVEPVRAEAFIYIRADGSIDPPSTQIQKNGDIYTLNDDIFNATLVVERNNITLDGSGHMLRESREPPAHCGVDLSYRKNVTVSNFVVSGFAHGLWLDSSYYNDIVNNTVLDCGCYGIKLYESYGNTLKNNSVTTSVIGIYVLRSNHNLLVGNEAKNNQEGITLVLGTQNTLRNNTMSGNTYNFYAGGLFLTYYVHDIDTSNLVDGKPICYWINRCGETVPSDCGQVIIVNSSKITVKNLELKNAMGGVILASTRDSLIENVTSTENYCAIDLDHSDNNMITKNRITDSEAAGIGLTVSTFNNITYNTVTNTTGCGIWIEDSGYETVIGNNILRTNQAGGSYQEFEGAGILVDDSSRCNITENNLVKCAFGIVAGAGPATSNLIARNNIVSNGIGLVIAEGIENSVHHNNFVENDQQVSTLIGTTDAFDSGYPSGGNYWSDYSSIDSNSGEFQNMTGTDGIGDAPYIIDDKNQDRYPLTVPPIPIPIVWNETFYPIGISSNSTVSWFSFNESKRTISFNVTGPEYSTGFCNLTFANALIRDMWQDDCTVLINGAPPLNIANSTDGENTYFHFTYPHIGHSVTIIREFPLTATPFLMLLFVAIIIIALRKGPAKRRQPSSTRRAPQFSLSLCYRSGAKRTVFRKHYLKRSHG